MVGAFCLHFASVGVFTRLTSAEYGCIISGHVFFFPSFLLPGTKKAR